MRMISSSGSWNGNPISIRAVTFFDGPSQSDKNRKYRAKAGPSIKVKKGQATRTDKQRQGIYMKGKS